jgi:hypothetical protein
MPGACCSRAASCAASSRCQLAGGPDTPPPTPSLGADGAIAVANNFVTKFTLSFLPCPAAILLLQMLVMFLCVHGLLLLGLDDFPDFTFSRWRQLLPLSLVYLWHAALVLRSLQVGGWMWGGVLRVCACGGRAGGLRGELGALCIRSAPCWWRLSGSSRGGWAGGPASRARLLACEPLVLWTWPRAAPPASQPRPPPPLPRPPFCARRCST